MALTQFAFCAINADMPHTAYFEGSSVEGVAPTGTSAATTAAATASQGVCRVATDTAVYVTFGTAPTATTSNGFYCPANTVNFFRVQSGYKAAVKT